LETPIKKRIGPVDFIVSWGHYRRFHRLAPDQRSIVFYSESGQDWHHFEPLVNYLVHDLSRTVCYVTSDPQDPGLQPTSERLHSFYIKEGYWQILFFQFIKADVMVLTMIDLGVFHLKRSINAVHYIYIFHAMGSTHMVDYENSYDNYDTLFCVGPHQMREIRRREELKGLPAKQLFAHGYARVEQLRERAARAADDAPGSHTQPAILLAPTWGADSILPVCGERLAGILLDAGFRLILRPHYQTLKLTPGVVDAILKKYGSNRNLEYIKNMGDVDSLLESDLLICDWSSTSIEYALALEKPVLYIDVPRRVRNPRYKELGIEPMEVAIRNEIGAVLDPGELEKAPEVIRKLLSDKERFAHTISDLREKVVFNFGNSVQAGAREIARIADALKTGRAN